MHATDRPFRGKPYPLTALAAMWDEYVARTRGVRTKPAETPPKPKALKAGHHGPVCQTCGYLTRAMGSCHFCDNCMTSTGCS
jgi:hypothetical protein